MKIFAPDGKELLDVYVSDKSYRFREVMGKDEVILNYSLPVHTELPVGAYIVFGGTKYTLLKAVNLTMEHTERYDYTVRLHSVQELMNLCLVVNNVDGRTEFPLTAKPHEHLELIVNSLNKKHPSGGWKAGKCPEAKEVTIAYSSTYCFDAVKQLAEALKEEFYIDGSAINIGRFVLDGVPPLQLSYGEGNGVMHGLERASSDDYPVGKLYVRLSDRNIDPKKYGAKTLRLPKSTEVAVNGTTYKTDEEGRYIYRVGALNVEYLTDAELVIDEEVYPHRVGKVSAVNIIKKESGDLYDIVDSSIPDTLNYEEYLIPDNEMTIRFESGMLAGKEFGVKYVHTDRRFEIVPKEIDGVMMPTGAFAPVVGDEYGIFGCMLPDQYLRDAENEALQKSAEYLDKNKDDKVSFKFDVDGMFAKKNWANIQNQIRLGAFVNYVNKDLSPEPISVRIISIKEYLNEPYAPELKLSNNTPSPTLRDQIREYKQEPVFRAEEDRKNREYTQRRFQDAKETMEMLKGAIEGFTDGISPSFVHTMQLLIGDESLQYRFIDDKATPESVDAPPVVVAKDGTLAINGAIIQHMTLGIDTVRSNYQPSEYKYWDVAPLAKTAPLPIDKSLYLYIKASKTTEQATWVLSEVATPMHQEAGYYHFLNGVINRPQEDGSRTYVPFFGFTEITPGRISADRFESSDGKSWIDWSGSGSIHFAFTNSAGRDGYFDINGIGDGAMRLKGVFITVGGEDTTIEDAIAESDRKIEEERKARERAEEEVRRKQEELEEALAAAKQSGAQDVATLTDLLNKANQKLGALEKQVDKEVSNWFYPGAPSTTKLPESEWTTNALKANHINDTYTSIDKSGQYMGKSWRYTTEFKWQEIHDTLISQALSMAANAQTTADGKSTTYLAKPTKYEEGDTWVMESSQVVNGISYEAGTMLFAKQGSSVFIESHWVDKVRYIGATQLKESEAASKAAWEAYANAQAEAERVKAEAHADGIVTAEEQARIEATNKALETAKAYAEAQDALLEQRQKAYADGVLTEAEQRAIEVAESKAKLAETNAKAYSDGVLTEAEKKAIAEAQKAYDDAVAKAKELDGQIQVGGRNLIPSSSWEAGHILSNDGTNSTINRTRTENFIEIEPNTLYTFSKYMDSVNNFMVFEYDESQNFIEVNDGKGTWMPTPEKFTFTTKQNTKYVRFVIDISYNKNNVKDYKVKFEKGTVATDWSEAPEDVEARITDAKTQADKAVADAKAAQDRANDTYTKAMMDGIITAEEEQAIQREANVAQMANLYADDKAAEAINTAKVYADGKVTAEEQARTNAIKAQAETTKAQAEAYADGKVTAEEQARIKAMQEAEKAAKAEYARLQKAQTLIGAIGTGKPINDNPTFADRGNVLRLYNYTNIATNTLKIIDKTADNPVNSEFQLRYTYGGENAGPGLGGFSGQVMSRANGVFVIKIIAKIPKGYKIVDASNPVGDNPRKTWLSSQDGTGDFETYYFALECGSTGTFGTFGFFYFYGTSGVAQTFDIAFYQVYDITDYYNTSKELQDSINATNKSITDLQTNVTTSIRDGILDDAEKKSLNVQIDLLRNERDQIIASYNKVYANTQLAGTPKTNLLNAKISYEGAVNALINTLNNLIAKGTAIDANDRNTVNSQFSAVRSALVSLQIALDEANEYLRKVVEGKVSEAEQRAIDASKSYTDLKASVEVIDADTKRFKNVAGYSKREYITGYLVITSPIQPHRMTRTIIDGFNYMGSNIGIGSFELDISAYIVNATGWNTLSFVQRGSVSIPKVQVARTASDTTGALVFIIGLANTIWGFPKVAVRDSIVGYQNPPDRYMNGWDIKITDDISMYHNITEVSGSNLQADIYDAVKASADLKAYVDGAFVDGIISDVEAKDIANSINEINSSYNSVIAEYNKLYANPLLAGNPKTKLLNTKTTFVGAKEALVNAINTAIADKKATPEEKRDVDAKYVVYNDALSALCTAMEDAREAIRDKGVEEEKRDRETMDNALLNKINDANVIIDSLKQITAELEEGKLNAEDYQSIEWLLDAFNNGNTTIAGGLLLTKIISLSNRLDQITAYLSGYNSAGNAMLKAGVTNYGGTNELENTAINHDGTGHLGGLFFDDTVINFEELPTEKGVRKDPYMRIGKNVMNKTIKEVISADTVEGYYPAPTSKSLAISTAGQDVITTVNVPVANDGTRITIELDMSVNVHDPSNNTGGIQSTDNRTTLTCYFGQEHVYTVEIYWVENRSLPGTYKQMGVSFVQGLRSFTWANQGTVPLRFTLSGPVGARGSYSVAVKHWWSSDKRVALFSEQGFRFFNTRSRYTDLDYRRLGHQGVSYEDYGATLQHRGGLDIDWISVGEIHFAKQEGSGAVLAGAKFGKNGNAEKQFGKYYKKVGLSSASCEINLSTMIITVYHSIPHNRYVPMITISEPNAARTATVISISAYSFQMQIYSGFNKDACGFSYVAFQAD